MLIINSGKGNTNPTINNKYKNKCKIYGVKLNITKSNYSEVSNKLEAIGLKCLDDVILGAWTKELPLAFNIDQLRRRVFSFTTIAENDTHILIINELEEELKQKYKRLDKAISIPNEFRIKRFIKMERNENCREQGT